MIVIAPDVGEVFVGSTILLSCVATGSFPLSINWRKEDVTLSNDSIRITIYATELEVDGISFVSSVLEICSLELLDSGPYSCLASTPGSSDRANFTITVSGQAPELVITSEDVNVTSGSSVFLSCVAYGDPLPAITWQRRTGMVVTDLENTTSTEITNEILDINEAQFVQSILLVCSDELNTTAVYSCIASNALGSVNDSFVVTVEAVEGMYVV